MQVRRDRGNSHCDQLLQSSPRGQGTAGCVGNFFLTEMVMPNHSCTYNHMIRELDERKAQCYRSSLIHSFIHTPLLHPGGADNLVRDPDK